MSCLPQPAEPGPKNLLLLTADSLRADRLSLWTEVPTGKAPIETPAIAELASRGALFDNTWAVTPWTAPSVVSAFTGLYPPSHGVVHRDDTTPADLPTLATLAADDGLEVANFTFFSRISYFRNLGLPDPPGRLAHGREWRVFGRWLDSLAEGNDDRSIPPFFAWIHLLEPHLPYGSSGYRAQQLQVEGSTGLEASQLQATVPVGSAEFAEGDRETLLQLYDDDIVRLDEQVRRIVDRLEQDGLLEDTLIVFLADHGEELLEDGWVGHASTAVEAKLMPETLRIPLLFSWSGLAPSRSSALVQHVDVLPTVARLMKWRDPEVTDGRDLLATPGFWQRLAGGAERSNVFFDSSVGGNLTPIERRGERMQGATDGDCLVVSETSESAGEVVSSQNLVSDACSEAKVRALRGELDEWRQQQGTQRLEVLQRWSLGGSAPADADEYQEQLTVVVPQDEAILRWGETAGLLQLVWRRDDGVVPPDSESESESQAPVRLRRQSEPAPEVWIQYRAGDGLFSAEGAFRIESLEAQFGPFPEGFWNDVAGYAPFEFRVLEPATRSRSPWVTFHVEEASRRAE